MSLCAEDRTWRLSFIHTGAAGARQLKRAHLLLLASAGKAAREVAEALHAALQPVGNIRKQSGAGGLAMALQERPCPGGARQLTATAAAPFMALACRAPPAARVSWTMHLVADTRSALEVGATVAAETVRRTRKKTA